MSLMFKILPSQEWEVFRASGRFAGSAVDLRDGYIHFSYRDQVEETARRHFAGQADLMLLGVDRAALGANLRDEVSRGGALFPHLYAELELAQVIWARPVTLDGEGNPILPIPETDEA